MRHILKRELINLLLLLLIIPYFLIAKNGVNPEINLYVLSFDNLSEDPEIDWLRNGFVDFIINHYNYIKAVNANRTSVLEKTLKEIHEKPELKNIKNIILSGNYKRDKGKFYIKIQLTDLNTLETLVSKEIRENTSDLGKVVESVNNALDEMIIPWYKVNKKNKIEVKQKIDEEEGTTKEKTDEIKKVFMISQATKNISFALDKLEKSYINKSIPGKKKEYTNQADIYYKKTPSEQFSKEISDYFSRTTSFEDIIYRIVENPYKIEISDPTFKRAPSFPDRIEMIFSINYQLRRNVIKDMLETLPCSKRVMDDFAEYSFSNDQFIFKESLLDKISRGLFRSFPIILLSDKKDNCIFNIIDIPLALKPNVEDSSNLLFSSKFTPIFNISASASSVKVYLQNKDIEIRYKIVIPISQLSKLSQITVKMLSEDEISKFVSCR